MKKRAAPVCIPEGIQTTIVCHVTGEVLQHWRPYSDAERFALWVRTKIKRPRLLDRVLEANKDIKLGEIIRGGWRRDKARRWELTSGMLVPKGWIVRTHGRAFWESLPRAVIVKDGKRAYVRHVDLLLSFPGLP